MQIAKDNITFVVHGYLKLFPDEYQHFQNQIKVTKDKQSDKFATTGMDYIERAMFEIPETLYVLLKAKLSEEELQWLWNDKSKEGARWFVNSFPMFKLTHKA